MKFLSKRFAATWFFAGTLLTGAALLSACAGDNAFVVGDRAPELARAAPVRVRSVTPCGLR
jgi:hypothetical protein